MAESRRLQSTLAALTSLVVGVGCGNVERGPTANANLGGGLSPDGGASQRESLTSRSGNAATGGLSSATSSVNLGSGGSDTTSSSRGGADGVGGSTSNLSRGGSNLGSSTTRSTSKGGTALGGQSSSGGVGKGGTASGGRTSSSQVGKGSTSSGGQSSSSEVGRGGVATGGASTSASTISSSYPCGGSTTSYNAVAAKSGSTWTVTNSGKQVYSGANLQEALVAAYGSLTSGRTSKQSILVDGSGDIAATAQVSIPSYTVLNVCGTINVSGTPSGSDRSPFHARNARDIEIPNLKMTGAPQYGIFMRQTDNVHLGQIDLRLSSSAGIGIRVDSGPSASTMTTFNKNLTIDHVYGSGMGSHIVETYGISDIKIGTIEGDNVGECGLLLNRSIHAEVDSVSCEDCAAGTGYAAFRIANDVGKVGETYPAGNIHVKKVYARAGGRGIFSVSGSGGLTIDQIDIAETGSTPILLQNCYNTTIAAVSGTVSGGLVQLSNDTDNTNSGKYLPSQNVTFSNLTLGAGASIRQDWCKEFGSNGSKATNITGGTVSMCP